VKNGKRPTLRQKKLIQKVGSDPQNWLVSKHTSTEMHLVHRYTGTRKVIPL